MDKEKQYQRFDEIYRLYSKAIYRFVYFKVSDFETAKDLTADTFLRFWKSMKNGGEIRNNKAFLFFIARGLVIDYYRKKKHINQVSLEAEEIDERLFSIDENTEKKIEIKEEINEVYQKLKEIKEEYREVIILHYIEDLEISQISTVLNKKENAVRVLLHRALGYLRKKYE